MTRPKAKEENGDPRDGSPEQSGDPARRNAASRASKNNEDADRDPLAAVLDGCRAGQRGAQRELYETFHRQVYRLMFRMVGRDDAPDLTQQVFLRVFGKIGTYAGEGRFDRWLYRVALNEAYQHLRRRQRRPQVPLVYEPADTTTPGGQRTEQKELLERALAQLDPELRSICLLREIEGLSYREIAETLEIPEGTVGSRLNRARRELREHLIRLGWEP